VGLKTATFTLDHDPESNVAKDLPATLMRIRNDEIFNILTKITQNQTISLTSVSQKIIGTIDPEQSNRPCVDALNLCEGMVLTPLAEAVAGPIQATLTQLRGQVFEHGEFQAKTLKRTFRLRAGLPGKFADAGTPAVSWGESSRG
jgi:hypothetical protein